MLSKLEEEYGFTVETDETNKTVEFIKFKDGREYKLQHPTFFQLHDALTSENSETSLFLLGLDCLYPRNDKSPKIDEEWLEKNKVEGMNLWSRLLRGLLSQPKS